MRSPHRASVLALFCVAVAATAAPAWAQATAASSKKLASVLQPFVDNHTLAGAVMLVASKEKVLDLETVGYADIAAQRPMPTDAVFWIASQTKPITAAALMMLVDEGKVNLNDPVQKYLPELKGLKVIVEQDDEHMLLRRPGHLVTVKNVLNHTSGFPFRSPIEQPTYGLLPLATAVRSYGLLPLKFEPDRKYQYSNIGTNIAGRIVEVVGGMPYEEFLDKRLLKPLGMNDTTFWPDAEQLARLVKIYEPNEDKTALRETQNDHFRYPLDDRSRQPLPAGGLFSTAADLSIFLRMIAQGGVFEGKRYLSREAVEQMTIKQTGDLPDSYGLCFDTANGCIGHGGAYKTSGYYYPRHQLIMILMVQHRGWGTNDGVQVRATFEKAAIAAYGEGETGK